jgi:hypothetical protein
MGKKGPDNPFEVKASGGHPYDGDHRHRRQTRDRVRRRRRNWRGVFAGLRDVVGGRSAGYEKSVRQARETEQLGADYRAHQLGQGGGVLMVSASGTAVKL